MKKIIILIVLMIFTFMFTSTQLHASEFVTDDDIFEPVTITSISLNADTLSPNRRITIYKIEFIGSFSELTITFDDVSGLSDGLPAIYFASQATSFTTLSFLQMNINGDGGLGDNLFYFNDPMTLTDNEVYVHISIDSVLDPDYINNATAIINDARFSFMDPYTFTTHVGLYTDSELLELVLIARLDGYQEGVADTELVNQNTIDNAVTDALDDVHLNGFEGYSSTPLDDETSYSYFLGYSDAISTDSQASRNAFYTGFEKWIVPAILIVMFVGGFFSLRNMKRSQGD